MAIFLNHRRKTFLRDFRHRATMPRVKFLHFSADQVRTFQAEGFFSQYGQDNFISSLPQLVKSDGIYVDAGCNHPEKINNTIFFEKKGWKGIAIDPLPLEDLWQNRTAEFVQCALGDSEGTAQIDIPSSESGLQSDNLVRLDMFSQIRDHEGAPSFTALNTESTLTVEKRTLASLFHERRVTHVDFLSIDVEGYEMNVLRGIDFKKVSVSVISIENNRPYPYGHASIRSYLAKQGFLHFARIHPVDDVFIRCDLLPFFERYRLRLTKDYQPHALNGEL